MASKKKKSVTRQRNQRQQKKQQRRDQRQKRRQTTAVQALSGANRSLHDLSMVFSDELLADFGSGTIKDVLDAAWNSEALFDEPEFDDLAIEPVEVAGLFMQTAEEMAVEPSDINNTDRMQPLLAETIKRLLTPEFCEMLTITLEELRDRAREEGPRRVLRQAAAVQLVLEAKLEDYYKEVGLLYDLVRQNIDAGFVLLGLIGTGAPEDERDPEQLAATEFEKFGQTVKENRALDRYLIHRADAIEQDGLRAMLDGEMAMHLFTEEEKLEATNRLEAELAKFNVDDADVDDNVIDDQGGESEQLSNAPEPTSEDTASERATSLQVEGEPRSWILTLGEYINEIFTTERIAAFHRSFNAYVDDPATKEQPGWEYAALVAKGDLAEADINLNQAFLIAALWQEINPLLRERDMLEQAQEDEVAEDEVAEDEVAEDEVAKDEVAGNI